MDLPVTLEDVLQRIVEVCRREYDRIAAVVGDGGDSAGNLAQAEITALVAQKDLLTYREKMRYTGGGKSNGT